MQNNSVQKGFIKPLILGIIVSILVIVLIVLQKSEIAKKVFQSKVTDEPVVQKEIIPEIATDPSFKEIKGQLLSGIPDFPVYPGAKLVGSAQNNPEGQKNQGYRAKWITNDSIPEIMKWYEKEIPKIGWEYESPNDPNSQGEQVAQIKKGNLKGYVAAEAEGTAIEIVIYVKEN